MSKHNSNFSNIYFAIQEGNEHEKAHLVIVHDLPDKQTLTCVNGFSENLFGGVQAITEGFVCHKK